MSVTQHSVSPVSDDLDNDIGGEIELVSDGDGIVVLGTLDAVERFLSSEGLQARELDLRRLPPAAVSTGGAALQAGSQVAANAGRWVKVTKESATFVKKFELMKGSTGEVSRAIVMNKGKTAHIVQFVRGPGKVLTNPAVLAGVGGIMAQLAMQQAMDEITDYLATIDKKVDDILRAQKDAVFADMIGVDLVIGEAMTVREQVGRVSEVTWSKVQGTSMTIARTQAYALQQLDALAEKMERETKIGDIASASKKAESKVPEWLAVLAQCFKHARCLSCARTRPCAGCVSG